MKIKLVTKLLIALALLKSISSFSQNNLIPNPGFEYGQNTPQCDYNPIDFIGDDIYDWKRATCNGLAPLYTCKYAYSYPDWMGPSCSGGTQIPSGSRFIYLQKVYKPNGHPKKGYEDAIRTGLLSQLDNVKYMFRIDYANAYPKTPQPANNSPTIIRIYLTKYSTHWSANWGNIKLSFLMYPPNQWVQHWMYLDFSGILGSIVDLSDLKNIVMDCEKGQVYIDYVELAKVCPDPLLIQNHSFYNNEDELPYKSGSTLIAGNNVDPSKQSGNVIVHNGATEKFTASSVIKLEPGFSVENGGNFVAKIEPCNSNNPNRYSAPTIQRTSENTFIYETNNDTLYIYDDAVDTLNCGMDSLKIFGLDGDTVSYTNYWWDYGNGITSNKKVAKIFYSTPGSYLVKLALTDSSGTTDTLSKTYVVPYCSGARHANPNPNRKDSYHSSISQYKTRIYPNPSYQIFNVKVSSEYKLSQLSVFDVTQRKISVKIIKTGNHSFKINMSNLAKGIYFLHIGNMVKRLVLE